tara:strand:+ start:11079 stop:11543 length:465 start_codon:yes stop_codon:yes gene_type:complete
MGQIKEISTNYSRIRATCAALGVASGHWAGNGFAMWIWRAVGSVAFVLGAIGLAVPVWPTTIFWIVAALAFAKSNPSWADWIYRQPGAGPAIKTFLETGAMARQAKIAALSGMGIAALIVIAFAYRKPWVLGLGLGLIAIGAVFVMTRKPLRDE